MTAKPASARRRVWPWFALAVVVLASVRGMSGGPADSPVAAVGAVAWGGLPILFVALGVLIELRQPGNRVGWLLMVIGGGLVFTSLTDNAVAAIDGPPDRLTTAIFLLLWIANVNWTTFVLPTLLLLIVFPNGYLLTRRWRWVPWLMGSMTVLLLVTFVASAEVGPSDGRWTVENPLGFVGPETVQAILALGVAALLVVVVGGIASVVMRFRRASTIERAQIKLVLVAVVFFGLSFGTAWADASSPIGLLLPIAFGGIPVAITLAVLRHGLFDIDLVISRTLSYAVLAGFVTGVYALIVVGIGTLVGGESNLALSIAAVAAVAMAFEPFRLRVQRRVNRLVYGERATPYEVLVQATRRLADTASPEETLARIVDLVVAGTGASEAALWMKSGDRLRPRSVSSPESLLTFPEVPVGGDEDPRIPGDASVLVRHRGELLGAVSITKPRGQVVTRADEKVLSDVAAGAGLLLRNIGLNAELAERADQLRASRRRLVEAHDTERRRLERDLHDGAQQQVVALKVKLGITRTIATREGADRVASIVESLAADTQVAVDEMRAVAHGIYPPLLESEGLGAALAALARSAAVPVVMDATGAGRYARSIEETIYFCILEAVNRVVDEGATRASIRLADTGPAVEFTVACDTAIDGMDAVIDRVDARGGTVTISSTGGEVALVAQIPVDQGDDAVPGGARLHSNPWTSGGIHP